MEDGYKQGFEGTLESVCNNQFYLNPMYTKSEDMKSILNEFKVVCCSKAEILSDSLKNVTFTRVLIDDANQMRETTMLLP